MNRHEGLFVIPGRAFVTFFRKFRRNCRFRPGPFDYSMKGLAVVHAGQVQIDIR